MRIDGEKRTYDKIASAIRKCGVDIAERVLRGGEDSREPSGEGQSQSAAPFLKTASMQAVFALSELNPAKSDCLFSENSTFSSTIEFFNKPIDFLLY